MHNGTTTCKQSHDTSYNPPQQKGAKDSLSQHAHAGEQTTPRWLPPPKNLLCTQTRQTNQASTRTAKKHQCSAPSPRIGKHGQSNHARNRQGALAHLTQADSAGQDEPPRHHEDRLSSQHNRQTTRTSGRRNEEVAHGTALRREGISIAHLVQGAQWGTIQSYH